MKSHYESFWGTSTRRRPTGGRAADLGDFSVLVFSPSSKRRNWTFATDGMAKGMAPIELHIISPVPDDSLVGLLAAVAHFHLTVALGLGHTVNFGQPWLAESACSFGLISLPYLDGPKLEHSPAARCLWLIPITEAERELKRTQGLEALEQRFQDRKIDYANPLRASLA